MFNEFYITLNLLKSLKHVPYLIGRVIYIFDFADFSTSFFWASIHFIRFSDKNSGIEFLKFE